MQMKILLNFNKIELKIINAQSLSHKAYRARKTKVNTLTTTLMSFAQRKDLGLIFPSWLMHYVPPATSPRISISWNVILRGNYGNPNELQNAHI